jgi:hypothetical protein
MRNIQLKHFHEETEMLRAKIPFHLKQQLEHFFFPYMRESKMGIHHVYLNCLQKGIEIYNTDNIFFVAHLPAIIDIQKLDKSNIIHLPLSMSRAIDTIQEQHKYRNKTLAFWAIVSVGFEKFKLIAEKV